MKKTGLIPTLLFSFLTVFISGYMIGTMFPYPNAILAYWKERSPCGHKTKNDNSWHYWAARQDGNCYTVDDPVDPSPAMIQNTSYSSPREIPFKD